MKKNKFWFLTAAAVVMTSMMFMSCSRDDAPEFSEIIESEVYESGVDNDVISTPLSGINGAEGTELSYQSWIVVKGQTRAAFENKVTVTLTNRFTGSAVEQEVSDFVFGQPETAISYRIDNTDKKQDYVTVTDSVLVYSLQYANGLTLNYDLVYESAVYDDGYTRQTMPYYQIENIFDNGLVLSDLDDEVVDGQTWHRKQCSHSITVIFNGDKYEIGVSVVAKSLSPVDYLISSQVVNEGIEEISHIPSDMSASYRSWIEVEQQWSESGIKTFKVETTLRDYVVCSSQTHTMNIPEKWDWMSYIGLTMEDGDAVAGSSREEESVVVTLYQLSRNMGVKINATGEKLVDSYTSFFFEKAVYTDEQLVYEMPGYEFENIFFEFSFTGEDWVERNHIWYHPIRLATGGYLNGNLYSWEYTNEFVYQP